MRKFELGKVFLTNGVVDLMFDAYTDGDILDEITKCVKRHESCDWGNLDEGDKMLNDMAVIGGGRILSAYEIGENKVKIWIITEADRNYTTILLPEEY